MSEIPFECEPVDINTGIKKNAECPRVFLVISVSLVLLANKDFHSVQVTFEK